MGLNGTARRPASTPSQNTTKPTVVRIQNWILVASPAPKTAGWW